MAAGHVAAGTGAWKGTGGGGNGRAAGSTAPGSAPGRGFGHGPGGGPAIADRGGRPLLRLGRDLVGRSGVVDLVRLLRLGHRVAVLVELVERHELAQHLD